MIVRHPALTFVERPASNGLEAQVAQTRRSWRMHRRRQLADGLERAVAAADRPPMAPTAQVPVNRAAVRRAREDLLVIAGYLRAPWELPTAAVAATRTLLRDGVGPLYVEGDLAGAVHGILGLLEDRSRP